MAGPGEMLTLILLLLAGTQPMLDERLVDFRLPATRVSSWGLSFGTGAVDESADSIGKTENYAQAAIGYQTRFESDSLEYGTAATIRSSTDRHSPVPGLNEERSSVTAVTSGNLTLYPFPAPFLVEVRASAGASTGISETQGGEFLGGNSREGSVELAPTIGVGRIRDARPVVQALWIEEVLKEQQLLRRSLAPDELQQLAQTIAKRESFGARRGPLRGPRYFYRALEELLLPWSGATRVPADAWLRIKEILDHTGEHRETGFQFTAGLDARGSLRHDVTVWPDSTRTRDTTSRYAFLTLSIRSGHPFTPHLHLSQSLDYRVGLTATTDAPEYSGTATLALLYELNELWLVKASWSGTYCRLVGPDWCVIGTSDIEEWWGPKYDVARNTFSLGVSRYVTDRLNLSAGCNLSSESFRTGRWSETREATATLHYDMSLRYRLQ
jgi:hypothetical protein